MERGDPGPGSLGLAELIDRCGEQLLSDFFRYYGLDIRDVLVPGTRLTPRSALALIRQLPEDSATIAELRGGPQFAGWDTDRYLTAQLIDSVRENTWVLIAANSKKKPKHPEPMPRPKVDAPKKTNQFAAMARAAYRKGAVKHD